MNKLPENFEMDKFGLHFRLVTEDDAAFILELRTDPELAKYLHKTENDLEKQKEWIREYKRREKEGQDYYFIVYYKSEPRGLDRIYNIKEDTYEIGSLIFKQDSGAASLGLLAELVVRALAYNLFPQKTCHGDVTKGNEKQLKWFDSVVIREDGERYYQVFPKENYEKEMLKTLHFFHLNPDEINDFSDVLCNSKKGGYK